MLPSYDVFDNLACWLDGTKVTLVGQVTHRRHRESPPCISPAHPVHVSRDAGVDDAVESRAAITIHRENINLGLSIETVELLLLVAALVAILARRLRLPYSVGLVIAGISLAFLPFVLKVELTKELIFTVLLPPLIFEAAFYLHWKELRRDLLVILFLASVGVLLSAAATAFGMRLLVGWQWPSALVFGVLIAATDPVSVIATFKESGVTGRLRLLVEAESLFNDGTSAATFGVAVALAAGQSLTPFDMGATFLETVGGGILCGALVAGALLLIAGRTNDHLVEITITTVAAYGSFLLAEHLHLSGVLATLTAGLMLGSIGTRGAISDKGRAAVEAFWEYAAFVANSLESLSQETCSK